MSGNTESTSNSIKFEPMPMSALLANLMSLQAQDKQDPPTADSSYLTEDSDDSTCEAVAKGTPIQTKAPKFSTPTVKSHGKEPKKYTSEKKVMSQNKENLDDNWFPYKTYLNKDHILQSANKNIKYNPFPSSEVKKPSVLVPHENNIQKQEGVNGSATKNTPEALKRPSQKIKIATPKIKSGIRKYTPGSSRKSHKKTPIQNILHNRDKVRCELFVKKPVKNELPTKSEQMSAPVMKPSVLAQAQIPTPVPDPTSVLAPALATTPALAPTPASTAVLVSAPVPVSAPFPVSTSIPVSAAFSVSIPTPVYAPVPVSAPVSVATIPVSATVPASTTVPVSASAPASAPTPTPIPASALAPVPAPAVPETPINRKKQPTYAATPSYPQGQKGNSSKFLFQTLSIKDKKYMFIKKLGTGGSSAVYKVLEVGTSNEYAVKCVYLATDQELAQGYINEVRLLRELQNSDRVIRLYDYEYDRTNQLLRLVLEVGETDLSSFLKARGSGLPPALVLHYWEEMLLAVLYIHEHGVIHADLKPANFLLVCGRLKLIDFGIASAISGDATSVVRAQAAGTYSYISPEALMGGAGGYGRADDATSAPIKISFRSDVWSLGCILYSMVYGRTPFSHIPNLAKLAAILDPNHRIDYPPVDHLPPTLIASLKWCLTYNARARPSVRELLSVRHLAAPRSHLPQTLINKVQPHLTPDELKLLKRAQV